MLSIFESSRKVSSVNGWRNSSPPQVRSDSASGNQAASSGSDPSSGRLGRCSSSLCGRRWKLLCRKCSRRLRRSHSALPCRAGYRSELVFRQRGEGCDIEQRHARAVDELEDREAALDVTTGWPVSLTRPSTAKIKTSVTTQPDGSRLENSASANWPLKLAWSVSAPAAGVATSTLRASAGMSNSRFMFLLKRASRGSGIPPVARVRVGGCGGDGGSPRTR